MAEVIIGARRSGRMLCAALQLIRDWERGDFRPVLCPGPHITSVLEYIDQADLDRFAAVVVVRHDGWRQICFTAQQRADALWSRPPDPRMYKL